MFVLRWILHEEHGRFRWQWVGVVGLGLGQSAVTGESWQWVEVVGRGLGQLAVAGESWQWVEVVDGGEVGFTVLWVGHFHSGFWYLAIPLQCCCL